MGWKSPAEADRDRLLRIAEEIENARYMLNAAARSADSTGKCTVSVTDPLAAAIVKVDESLIALDAAIGAASRKVIRERPKVAEEVAA